VFDEQRLPQVGGPASGQCGGLANQLCRCLKRPAGYLVRLCQGTAGTVGPHPTRIPNRCVVFPPRKRLIVGTYPAVWKLREPSTCEWSRLGGIEFERSDREAGTVIAQCSLQTQILGLATASDTNSAPVEMLPDCMSPAFLTGQNDVLYNLVRMVSDSHCRAMSLLNLER
jgi:hypothetical protein